jgi:hypothetical protein
LLNRSGYVAPSRGIAAIEATAQGAALPVCCANTDNPLNGLEVNFKGGQVDAEEFGTRLQPCTEGW